MIKEVEKKPEKLEKTLKSQTLRNSQSKWEFTVVKYLFVILFFALIYHFIDFQINESSNFINNDYNSREELFAERVTRGDILSADGYILAETILDENGEEVRYYPYNNLFFHTVGFATNGKSGIEKMANYSLLKAHVPVNEKVQTELNAEKYKGDKVITTLNYELQKVAYDALSGYEGAVVVLEPSTGKILAMVSKPDYNPNHVKEDWAYLVSSDNTSTALLNRATQGLYPPGSTFKVITTLAFLRNEEESSSYIYDCKGKHTSESAVIHCINNKKHGEMDLEGSFAESCNASFANIGLTLDNAEFQTLCNQLLFNQELPTEFRYSKSSFQLEKEAQDAEVVQAAIGQGTTLVTPFHMALVTSAIANDGTLMTPYIIDRVENHKGEIVTQYQPALYEKLLSEEETLTLQQYMKAVVEYGTGKKLQSDAYAAAGKTGSAEFSSQSTTSHSWFIGYAEGESKADIAVAILVEEAGTGSAVAVPIAKEIFDIYFSE